MLLHVTCTRKVSASYPAHLVVSIIMVSTVPVKGKLTVEFQDVRGRSRNYRGLSRNVRVELRKQRAFRAINFSHNLLKSESSSYLYLDEFYSGRFTVQRAFTFTSFLVE